MLSDPIPDPKMARCLNLHGASICITDLRGNRELYLLMNPLSPLSKDRPIRGDADFKRLFRDVRETRLQEMLFLKTICKEDMEGSKIGRAFVL